MGKLSEDEAKMLRQLTEKAKAPDTSDSSKTLNISIDLGDPEQVKRGQKLGLLSMFSDDEGEGEGKEGEGEGEGEGEETPKRKGFFSE